MHVQVITVYNHATIKWAIRKPYTYRLLFEEDESGTINPIPDAPKFDRKKREQKPKEDKYFCERTAIRSQPVLDS